MQIDNWLCKFGKLKSGALTKNKGVLQFWAGNGVPPRWGGMSIHIFNPKNEVGAENSSKGLIGSGSGRRRRGNLAPAGCRRGAHGVTRPTALGARQVFSNALPTSEFGLLSSNRISTSFIVACFQNGFGWHRPLAGAVRRLAGRNGEPHFSGNGAWEKPGAPGHSGWRVANRDGRVARSTHFENTD